MRDIPEIAPREWALILFNMFGSRDFDDVTWVCFDTGCQKDTVTDGWGACRAVIDVKIGQKSREFFANWNIFTSLFMHINLCISLTLYKVTKWHRTKSSWCLFYPFGSFMSHILDIKIWTPFLCIMLSSHLQLSLQQIRMARERERGRKKKQS